MKLILILLLGAALGGCSSYQQTRPDGSGVKETALLTKGTLAGGSSKVEANGGSDVRVSGLATDQMSVVNAMVAGFLALAQQAAAAQADAAQARAQLNAVQSLGLKAEGAK